MNAKPISHRALCLAALHCTHPELDGTDKGLLACLLENGEHGTGENCRPGNRNLMDVVRLTKRPLDARIDRLIQAGLIQRTERGDGRGKASVYSILWRSPSYPDRTPNGEWLVPQPGAKPGCVDSHVYAETGLPKVETGLLAVPKPGCVTAETGLSGQPHTISAPESKAHTETHTPACQPKDAAGKAGGGSCGGSFSPKSKTEQERWVEFIKTADLPDTMKYAQPTEEERHKVLAQLDAIVLDAYDIKHGHTKAEILGSAIADWEELQSPPLRTLAYGRWKRWLETGERP